MLLQVMVVSSRQMCISAVCHEEVATDQWSWLVKSCFGEVMF